MNASIDDPVRLSNRLQGLNVQWARLHLFASDPGQDGVIYEMSAMDEAWQQSPNIRSQKTRHAYGSLRQSRTRVIFTMDAPASWLTSDGLNELRGDALVAFARYWTSAIVVHRRLGVEVKYVELVDEPSTNVGTFVSPDNLVILVTAVRCMLQQRGISDIFIMGPGLPTVISRLQQSEPYISAFRDKEGLLDAWSVHAVENPADVSYYNSGSFAARKYMSVNLQRNLHFMKWTIPGIPIFVTKFATAATKYNAVDFGPGAPEMVHYGIRLMDNLTAAINSGATTCLAWSLQSDRDVRSIHRKDGSRRPQRDALSLVTRTLPTSGMIFPCVDDLPDEQDQTLKAAVVSGNSFGIILSRGQPADGLSGQLILEMLNPAWTSGSALSTVSVYCFPDMIDISGMKKEVNLSGGKMLLHLDQVPYNCTIFIKGDIYDAVCTINPPIVQQTMSFPKVSDLSAIHGAKEGDIVFHVQASVLKIFAGGVWKPCQVSTVSAT